MPIQNAIGIPPTSSPNGRFDALSLPQSINYENLLLNPSFEIARTPSGTLTPAALWRFTPNVAGANTASTAIGSLDWNQTAIPTRKYLEYTQTAQNGVRGTIECRLDGVGNFAGQTLSFAWWLWSSVEWAGTSLQITQNFGTGGSPSASVAVNATVNGQTTWTIPANTWTLFTGTVQVPSVASATLGTNGNDFLSLSLRPGGTTIGTIRIAAPGVYLGSIAPPYRARSPQLERLLVAGSSALLENATLVVPVSILGSAVGINNEITAHTFTVPGSTLYLPGHRLEIGYRANVSPNTNAKTIRIRHLTQNQILQGNAFTLANQAGLEINRRLTYTSATTARTPVSGLLQPDFGTNTNAFPADIPIDWTADNTFSITGQLANAADTIDLLEVVVRVLR